MANHYYDLDGKPRYEVTGVNGKLRPTNVTDAKKLGLVPSVTTVLDQLSKPNLINWIQEQLLDASILKPYKPEDWENVQAYKDFLTTESRRIGKEASQKGTLIHDAIEQYFLTGKKDKKYRVYIESVIECLNDEFSSDVIWISEESFASSYGFGGKVDLHSKSHNIIVDFKTKDKENIKAIKAYDEQKMQLSAYHMGLQLPMCARRFNLFISTAKGHEGEYNLVESEDYFKPWNMFYHLLEFWKERNNYNPSLLFINRS